MFAMVLHFAWAALNGSRTASSDEAQTAAICANQSSALHAVKKRKQPNTFDLMFTTITLGSKTSNAEYVTNQGRKQRPRLTKRTTKHFAVFNAAGYAEKTSSSEPSDTRMGNALTYAKNASCCHAQHAPPCYPTPNSPAGMQTISSGVVVQLFAWTAEKKAAVHDIQKALHAQDRANKSFPFQHSLPYYGGMQSEKKNA